VHGDIKPENCLFDVNESGAITKFVLGDFGDVKLENHWEIKFPLGTLAYHDPYYLKVMQHSGLSQLTRNNYMRKNDIYALSKTMIEVILNRYLHNVWQISDPVHIEEWIELITKQGFCREVAALLVSGLNTSDRRPNIDEFATNLRNAIGTQLD
jgi:serine/threonine protein kinase